MRAVLLSAGQGSRLLPLTADRPKCLLALAGRPLIEWQVRELARAGIDDIAAVVGFRAELVEECLAGLARPGLALRAHYNPFYAVADNLGSCWIARGEMDRDFLLVNGDTVFRAAIALKVLAAPSGKPIVVAIDRKSAYDADDMKVRVEGTRLHEIGKTLPGDRVNGESIGMLLFRGDGPRLFRDEAERALRGGEGIKWWYLKVIDALARRGLVDTVSIEGLPWGEVDYRHDLERADELARRWLAEDS